MTQTPVDWRRVQGHLGVALDGTPGAQTVIALVAHAAARTADGAITGVGTRLAKSMSAYSLTTVERLAEFIAETAHESEGYTRFEENLNYSAQGLANTWPTRYAVDPHARVPVPNATAILISRNPEAIGNSTYGLRMGNLDSAHDTDTHPDGWEYRGRGPGELTGRCNYAAMGAALGVDLVANPDLASDPSFGTLIALEFWRQHKVASYVDAGNYTGSRHAWNGGSIGVADVAAIRARLFKLFTG